MVVLPACDDRRSAVAAGRRVTRSGDMLNAPCRTTVYLRHEPVTRPRLHRPATDDRACARNQTERVKLTDSDGLGTTSAVSTRSVYANIEPMCTMAQTKA